eukprot:8793171-Heterocapsa_arctica.AAC.1
MRGSDAAAAAAEASAAPGAASSSKSSRQGTPWQHPGFTVVMDHWESYLVARTPKGFIIEEVETFDREDPRTGLSYLQSFSEMCARYGYSIRAFKGLHSDWCELPRGRTSM